MLNMLTDLLDVNKIEQGHFDVTEGTSLENVSSFIMEIIEQEKPIAKNKNLLLLQEVDPDITAIPLNVKQLHRVFQNLLGNAFKFTPAGGEVWVRAKKAEGGVLFQVEDNGYGVEKELLPFLFERFSQGKKKVTEGSGLGLAIAKGIVEAHEGKIWVESNPGQGSKFNFYIPFTRNNLRNESGLVHDQLKAGSATPAH